MSGAFGPAGSQLELGQPLHGLEPAGRALQQLLQRLPLPLGVAGPCGEPGAEGEDLLRRNAVRRQVLEGAPASATSPVAWPSPADSSIPPGRAAAPQAGVEPALGLVEMARPDRQVGPTEPDPVVVRRVLRRLLQGGPDLLDRFGVDRVQGRQLPEQAESVGVVSQPPRTSAPDLREPTLEGNKWTASRGPRWRAAQARMAVGNSASA